MRQPDPMDLWINPAVGVAGDMLLAALIDVGASLQVLRDLVGTVGLPDWSLDTTRGTRRGITATAVTVSAPDHDHHRSWSTIDAMLAAAALPDPVRDGARATFRRLAVAEASVHGIGIDDVHFHEVGAVDAIVDVVGAWSGWFDLGMPTVTSAPVGLGTGTAPMAHGTLPTPAPATLELLRGHPSAPVDTDGETATPTGVAILTTMAEAWGPMPAGTIAAIGRGAGTWDPPTHANVLTVVRYEPATGPTDVDAGIDVAVLLDAVLVDAVLIETTVDDVTPEVLGHVIDRALALGADDAWILPATMKKHRPGHEVRVLCRADLLPSVRDLLTSETGTLGLRESPVRKHELVRRSEVVDVDGHPVRIKIGPFGAKPEHDDVVAAATALGRPLRDVAADALAAPRSWGKPT
ncbi:MAG: nickel pincer cofactor biosynthesis protein LarC [Actinobacteria bacterium]|nr:nickel pincer cofactor biosynthesis protein LarC [Actinomycetota bacterium]